MRLKGLPSLRRRDYRWGMNLPNYIQPLARRLQDARREAREIDRLTQEVPGLSLDDAYAIQEAGGMLRQADGERQVGLKMGLTSEAKRKQMSLDSPVFGVLTDRMQIPDGGTLPLKGSIHPKIEPEVAFRIEKELRGAISLAQAAAACSGVTAAMEILDSRYVGFKYFSLPDVIADNSSSFMFVVSNSWHPLAGLELDKLEMTMSVNGEVKQRAVSSAISGHPLTSIVQLCQLLAKRDRALPAGSIVLAGAATVAEMLHPGDRVELTVEGLGSVSLSAA
jgi:2-oxo-3-hexenedioate decarboxylase